jgi:hypothetical protein
MIVINLKDPNNIEHRFELNKSIVTVGALPGCDVPLSLVHSDKPVLYIRKSRDYLLLQPCVLGVSTRSGSALLLNADERIHPEEIYILPGSYSLQAYIQDQERMLEAKANFVVNSPRKEIKSKIGKTGTESGSPMKRIAAFAFLGVAILSLGIGSFFSSSDDAESSIKIRNRKHIYEKFAGNPNDMSLSLIRQAETHAAIGNIDKAINLYQEVLSLVGNSSRKDDGLAIPLIRQLSQDRIFELLNAKKQAK